jgi:plastocyanin
MRTGWRSTLMGVGLAALALCAAFSSNDDNPTSPTSAPTASATTTQTAATTPSSTTTPSTATDAVTIKDFAFNPASLTVKAGATVTWTNEDTTAHRVVGVSTGGFNAGTVATGETVTATFDTAGSFPYICEIHPQMMGTIVVE